MLGSGLTPRTTKSGRGWTASALSRLLGSQRRRRARPEETSAAGLPADDHALPAIVVRAREDARCRRALARLGYVKVRAHYQRHKREGQHTFAALGRERLAPTMDFVRDWLAEERKRIVARMRRPFLMTMLVTIVAGIVFAAVARVLE
ncbi:MAG TPA: hypothetical protein VN523_05910 [Hyphomicrobiaceae bacterium]|jgi:hypothetical protein|nr:hypothetical protein [Hyphomicrobiaceae bacterium]